MPRRDLKESLEFWKQSAEHDKKQLLLSLEIGSTGLALAGVSIAGIITGAPAEGGIGLVAGSGLAYAGGSMARTEVRSLSEANSLVGQRTQQLEDLEN